MTFLDAVAGPAEAFTRNGSTGIIIAALAVVIIAAAVIVIKVKNRDK